MSIAPMFFSFESACKPNWNRAAKVVHAYEDERSKWTTNFILKHDCQLLPLLRVYRSVDSPRWF